MLSPSRSGVISFGSFQLDPETGSLEKQGVRVRLPRQPARILKILAQRAGEVVTREELRDELWGSDTFVDFEHGLNAAINKLRQMLGDSAEKPRFIETLPGQGYRFVAAVRVEAPEPAATRRRRRFRQLRRPENAALAAAAGVRRFEPRVLGCGSAPGRREPPAHPPLPAKFVISPPNGSIFQPAGERQAFAVSPDGSRLAFTTIGEDGLYRLWIRPLTSLDAQEAPAARGAQTLFWSPAGDALYFSVERSLRRITDPGFVLPAHQRPSPARSAPGRVDRSGSDSPLVSPIDCGRAGRRRTSNGAPRLLSLAASPSRRQAPSLSRLR